MSTRLGKRLKARLRKHPRSFDEMREDASKRFSNILANLGAG